MSPSQIIVLATPVFLLLIAVEFAWGYTRGRNTYRLNDAINSISLGVLSQLGGLFAKLFTLGIYTAVYSAVALFPDTAFWSTWYGALMALVFYDFCYYWLHRAGHRSAVLWAAHVVHHQSQCYNLSTALRQTGSGPLLAWIFYLPMAIAGVPPLIFAIVGLVDLLYQFWVHTEQVNKLGWFDRVFCSPSNHRVHHAVNDNYLDKNYGGILILWDRLFGTFREEDEPCVYGTRGPLNSWDPLWANVEVYWALLQDSWHARNWVDKLRVWFKPPGWRAPDVALNYPKPAFELSHVQVFDPVVSRTVSGFAAAQFALLLSGVSAVLWFADVMPLSSSAVWSLALVAGYWVVGALLQGRITVLEALLISSAAVATATGALGLTELHHIFKPLTMVVAILFIAIHAYYMRARGQFDLYFYAFLALALIASLLGDVFLMLPGNYFIPGLASFLVAHLFYIALFKRGQSWFPSRRALLIVLAFGAAMYAVLWSNLPDPVLKAAVAFYVIAISLMTAQAIGRAVVLGDSGSRWVAMGACVFMLSDSLIAMNKFLQPLALAPLWILLTYYAAQILIVHNACKMHRPT